MGGRVIFGLVCCVLGLLVGCGGDDDSATTSTTSDQGEGAEATEPAPEPADDSEPAEEPEAAEQPPPAAGGVGAGTATLTLSNGEVLEFGILCNLESQEAAGSEILFNVVSYDDPYNLDVTQFGEDSFGGAANITVYDSTSYDTVWDASSVYGTDVELSVDGSTVTGRGEFLAGGELGAESVTGELVATC